MSVGPPVRSVPGAIGELEMTMRANRMSNGVSRRRPLIRPWRHAGITPFQSGGLMFVGAIVVMSAMADDIHHGYIDAEEIDCGNTPDSVIWTRVGGSGSWSVLGGNRGDIDTDLVAAEGVLITCPAELAPVSPCIGGGKGPFFVTTNGAIGVDGFYDIPMHAAPGGGEANCSVAAAYFPISTWTGGVGYVTTNGGPITVFHASSGLELRTTVTATGSGSEFIDHGNGLFDVRLDGIDAQRDGVVLGVSAKNEDNFASIFMRSGGDFTIANKDNGENGAGSEQDSAGFVFIPQNTPRIVMGRIAGSGATVFGQGDFVLAREGVGSWRLAIEGESAETGTLIVSGCGMEAINVDNPVWMEPDGDTWIIQSRDISGMTLQDIPPSEGFFHFAFLPNDIAGVVPGTPDRAYVDRLDDVVAGRYVVAEYAAGDGLEDSETIPTIVAGDALRPLGRNRGDQGFVWLDAMMDGDEGVIIPSISQGFRDNTATGGTSGWGIAAATGGEVRTFALQTAENDAGYVDEQNIDYALAFFPNNSGFAADVDRVRFDVLLLDSIDPADGVLLATAHEDTPIVVTANPLDSAFEVRGYRGRSDTDDPPAYGVGDLVRSMDVGWAYLPFSTPGVDLGQVSASGALVRGSTGVSVTRDGDDYRISSTDFDAATQGVLLLTPESPAALHWTTDGRDFLVTAIDLATGVPTATAFGFAIVPVGGTAPPVEIACTGDFNGDGIVSGADFGRLLSAWGPCFACPEDLDGDGQIAGSDLGVLLSVWGVCPEDPCEGIDCSDGDPCTVDSCVDGECFHDPIEGCNPACGDPSDNDCAEVGDPGCSDFDCCNTVCDIDPFCCDVGWDAACVDEAMENCG